MRSATFILPCLVLAIASAPAFGDVVVAKVAVPEADVQPAVAPADSPARPKPKRNRHRKAAAPTAPPAAGGTEAASAKPDGTHGERGQPHAAQPAPVVPAAVAPTPRVRVKDRAAAAAAVAATQAAERPPVRAQSHAVPAAPDVHLAHAAHEAAAATPTETVAAHGCECNPPFMTEVAALFDRWNASLRTGDPKKVVANYAPQSLLLPTLSNRARFTAAEKEAYFEHFLQRRPEGRIDDRVIEVDCNSAVDSGLYTFRFSDGSSVRARYTFAYKRVNGEWLISSHHSSAMPEKPAAGPGAGAAPAGATEDGSPARGWVRFP